MENTTHAVEITTCMKRTRRARRGGATVGHMLVVRDRATEWRMGVTRHGDAWAVSPVRHPLGDGVGWEYDGRRPFFSPAQHKPDLPATAHGAFIVNYDYERFNRRELDCNTTRAFLLHLARLGDGIYAVDELNVEATREAMWANGHADDDDSGESSSEEIMEEVE